MTLDVYWPYLHCAKASIDYHFNVYTLGNLEKQITHFCKEFGDLNVKTGDTKNDYILQQVLHKGFDRTLKI